MLGTDISRTHPVLTVNLVKAKKNGATRISIDSGPQKDSKSVDCHLRPNDLIGAFAAVYRRLAGDDKVPGDLPASTDPEISDQLFSAMDGKKTTILFGEGILDTADPQLLVAILANIIRVGGNDGKLIPLWTEGNAQGVMDMGALPGFLPGWKPSADKGIEYTDMKQGKVKALYTTEGVSSAPSGIEFLVLQDIFPSKTMDSADAVLPSSAFTETNGTATSLERRVQAVRACSKPPGAALDDWEIITRIAQALGSAGFQYTAPDDITREIISSGVNLKEGIQPFASPEMQPAPFDSGPKTDDKAKKDRYKGIVLQDVVEDLNILYTAKGAKNE